MKTIAIVGGAGYLGSIMTEEFLSRGYKVICFDRLFFGPDIIKNFIGHKNYNVVRQDSRDLTPEDFQGADVVIDLAGISNDPACELNEYFTECMNYHGPINVARSAKSAGVPRYIMASSCSIYGAGAGEQLTEESAKNPVSLYAKNKIKCESNILQLASDNFAVSFLRLATLFGVSYRMRFDLIINIMTMHALKNKKILVLGGGKQWRPLLHVRDAAIAFILAMEAPKELINGQAFNVGSSRQNYQVCQVAGMIQKEIPETEVIIAPDDPDKRDYNVNFDKITNVLGFDTKFSAEDGIKEVKEAIMSNKIDPEDMRTSTIRFYKYLVDAEKLLNEIKIDGKLY